jgi:phospholipase/carboxylesterase
MSFIVRQWEVALSDTRLFLLHGLGADENDLGDLAVGLSSLGSVTSLRAPIPYGPGFAWFDVQFGPDGVRSVDADGILAAGANVADFAGSCAEPRKVLIGFSQGAAVALAAAALAADQFVAVAALSGFPPPNFDLLTAADGPAILLQHGDEDRVVSPRFSEDMATALQGANKKVTHQKYPMGHTISPESFSDLRRWVAEILT